MIVTVQAPASNRVLFETGGDVYKLGCLHNQKGRRIAEKRERDRRDLNIVDQAIYILPILPSASGLGCLAFRHNSATTQRLLGFLAVC